jgi:hypothetical protein
MRQKHEHRFMSAVEVHGPAADLLGGGDRIKRLAHVDPQSFTYLILNLGHQFGFGFRQLLAERLKQIILIHVHYSVTVILNHAIFESTTTKHQQKAFNFLRKSSE